MSAVFEECPICMDPIESQKNCVTTACGHCFHTNCLMTSVAHNGFACPYCRTKMAEEVEEDDSCCSSEDDEYDNDELYDDYALRGLRLFNDNINGEEHDQEDIEDEEQNDDEDEDDEQENEENENGEPEPVPKPSPLYIAQKLTEQGITMEAMVKILLNTHMSYENEFDTFERVESEICGRLRTIVNNYNPV